MGVGVALTVTVAVTVSVRTLTEAEAATALAAVADAATLTEEVVVSEIDEDAFAVDAAFFVDRLVSGAEDEALSVVFDEVLEPEVAC